MNPDEPRIWKQRGESSSGRARTPGHFRSPEASEAIDNSNPACEGQQRFQNSPESPESPERATCRTTNGASHNEDERPASPSPRSPERPNGGALSPRSEVENNDNGDSSRSRTTLVGGETDPEFWEENYVQDEPETRHRKGMEAMPLSNTSPGHCRKESRLCASTNGKSSSLISVIVLNCPSDVLSENPWQDTGRPDA